MHDDEQSHDVVPGWEDVVSAGTVPAAQPAVLARAEQAIRAVAARDVARSMPRYRRRSWRLRLAGLGSAAVVVGGVVTFALVGGSQESGLPEPGASAEPVTGTGALRDGDLTASCVEGYDLETLRDRAFAFDGTVSDIDDLRDDMFATVTFDVHEWFRGDGGSEITLAMSGPGGTEDLTSEWGPAYGVGTRLLVSGEPRWGGATFDDPLAWTCGFTRYYDEATADQWRASLGRLEEPAGSPRCSVAVASVCGPWATRG